MTTKRKPAPSPLTAAELEDYSERAAIIEYLGGVPRRDAEAQAMALIVNARDARRLL